MRFGVVGRIGPGMRKVVGLGDRSTGRGNFRGECGAPHCKLMGSLWHSESAWHYDVDVAYQHRSDWTRLQWALQQQMSPFSPLEVATRPLLKRLSLLMLTVRGERSKSGIKSENV